ncbi:MAG: type II CRISPR RNA-guided endonuclease Cas9, partial [Bacteroidales bacterium]
ETYRLRARAAVSEISLKELTAVLLMINKKRGYKSSRKTTSESDEGKLINGMDIAKYLYDNDITPGKYVSDLLQKGEHYIPDFYRSDLQYEFDKICSFQKNFYPDILTEEFIDQIIGKTKLITTKIFSAKYGISPAENKGKEKKAQTYKWRVEALSRQLTKEELAYVISDINGLINKSSGYLGAISDRSKELYFNKQTVGQYLMTLLDNDPNTSLKNRIFYRQDYLDEFETIWEKQSEYHKELTPELKKDVRDVSIFYQRSLKSQKGLVGFCEFESREISLKIDGNDKIKRIGLKVCPKSSPLFQEFKIWQTINNIELKDKTTKETRPLDKLERDLLFSELNIRENMKNAAILKLLQKKSSDFEINYNEIQGNQTNYLFYKAYSEIITQTGNGEYDFSKMKAKDVNSIVNDIFSSLGYNADILNLNLYTEDKEFEQQPLYRLWHLLYSFESDNTRTGNGRLIDKLTTLFGFEKEYAEILAKVSFQNDYGNLSAKAIRKILPYLKDGDKYDVACLKAGYNHSKHSLTKDALDSKILDDKLKPVECNSLRNPIVEKILNQTVNVVNEIIDLYGKPDEIRVELARDLKKSAKEREGQTKNINETSAKNEKYRKILNEDFGIIYVSKNDILRYKLYLELKDNGFKTLYTNEYISKEKLFSKEFDIEHIIPQAKLFDDSFSNKTIERREYNIEKGNATAYDYVESKYGNVGATEYKARIDSLYKSGAITSFKRDKLLMTDSEIPSGFIDRDMRNTQYISIKAIEILEHIVKVVVPTTGSITNRLREDWQLINVMQELNWDKYSKLGLTETYKDKDGRDIHKIKDWTKRNDHRHHAMDALVIAFTKHSYIQYLNNLNARSDKSSSIYAIEQKDLYRDTKNKLKFKPPMPLNEFREVAQKRLEEILISINAKNKVTTKNTNIIKTKCADIKKVQITPRGQLHKESVFGRIQRYVTKEEIVGSGFNIDKIEQVANKIYRTALLKRLAEFGNDPKKAFIGKNSLDKNPLYCDELHTEKVPEKVKTVSFEYVYTIRKDISPDLNVDKVIDTHIKNILKERIAQYNGNVKEAFSNLVESPIWLNESKGISVKRVTINGGINNPIALHDKKDKDGNIIYNNGKKQPVDFVNTGNNHHAAMYIDDKGKLHTVITSFYEATMRAKDKDLSVVDKTYKHVDGWRFLFSLKQNEYFVFPNEATGFDPKNIDLTDPDNYAEISKNLYRVQKLSYNDYYFRHHLETTVAEKSELKGVVFKRCTNLDFVQKVVKVRIDHAGRIVFVGEY